AVQRRVATGLDEPRRRAQPDQTVLVLEPTPPRSTSAIQTLLRKRLLFIVVLVWTGLAVYGLAFLPSVVTFSQGLIWAFLFTLTGGLAGLLWSRRPLSLRALRGI